MNREEMMKRIRADAFPKNNGSVLSCINLLNRSGFSPLEQVRMGVENWGIEKAEFLDSIHFLQQAGYIEARTIEGKSLDADLADHEYQELEVRASEKGIRLMQGSLSDECVKV